MLFPPNDVFNSVLCASYGYSQNSFTAYEHRLRLEDIRNTMLEKKGTAAVDLGCGSGAMLALLCRNFSRVVGVDILQKNLAQAHKLCRQMKIKPVLKKGDMQKLDFKANTFDFGVATESMEHLPSMQKGFDELFRVLKKNGCAIVTVPNSQSILWKLVHVLKFLKLYSCPEIEQAREFHLEQHWKKTKRMLEKTGFRIKGVHSILAFPLPIVNNVLPRFLKGGLSRLWYYLARFELWLAKKNFLKIGSSVVFLLEKP